MTGKRLAWDARHDQFLWLVHDLDDSVVATEDSIAAGTLLAPDVAPQFYNPERHLPGCQIPDKMFRFCLCKEGT